MQLAQTLSETRTLWITFILSVLLTFSFQVVVSVWGVTLVDSISDPTATRAAIASMTAEQHVVHAWTTATLDVAYPLAYGAWFAGSAYKFFGRWGPWLAAPMYVLVGTDLAEGVVQVLALVSVADWLDLKAVLTPLKTVLFLFGLLMTVLGWVIWLVGRLRRPAAS